MKDPNGRTDDSSRRVLSHIEQYGWSISGVQGEGEVPSWVHTIGLWHSFDHPEIIVFGLDMPMLEQVANAVAAHVKSGREFEADQRDSDLLENHDVVFRRVEPAWYELVMNYAVAFYEDQPFDALQVFLPTNEGLFPWEEGFPEEARFVQPRLYESDASEAGLERLEERLQSVRNAHE